MPLLGLIEDGRRTVDGKLGCDWESLESQVAIRGVAVLWLYMFKCHLLLQVCEKGVKIWPWLQV